LLSALDPDPVKIANAAGRSPFLLTGDHAGNSIPEVLGTLGLADHERRRHIALDIGVAEIGALLAARLDAMFVAQNYSRLVIDCNRDPGSPEAVPASSDETRVPGNEHLEQIARDARIAQIHAPYHGSIADCIDTRSARGTPSILVALHSFTPSLSGDARPWHVGVLHSEGRTDFARALLAALAQETGLMVGDNEPYRMDSTDYSVPRHAFAAGLPYAEIEVRQDLIADIAGQIKWSAILERALSTALETIGRESLL
jgi:predicted N-formylglutamate amidohydrolase